MKGKALSQLIGILRKNGVAEYRLGDFAIRFAPPAPVVRAAAPGEVDDEDAALEEEDPRFLIEKIAEANFACKAKAS